MSQPFLWPYGSCESQNLQRFDVFTGATLRLWEHVTRIISFVCCWSQLLIRLLWDGDMLLQDLCCCPKIEISDTQIQIQIVIRKSWHIQKRLSTFAHKFGKYATWDVNNGPCSGFVFKGGIIFVKYGVLGKHTKHSCLQGVEMQFKLLKQPNTNLTMFVRIWINQVPPPPSKHYPLLGKLHGRNHFSAPISTRFQAESEIAISSVGCTQTLPFAFYCFYRLISSIWLSSAPWICL